MIKLFFFLINDNFSPNSNERKWKYLKQIQKNLLIRFFWLSIIMKKYILCNLIKISATSN